MDEYSRTNSLILQQEEELLFRFEGSDGTELYRGSQGFRVPKSGLFNITVAGAAGGRGICSIDSGKGLVWRGQVNLTEEDNLLILVGQKGVGPCDVQHDIELPLCQNPPNVLRDVFECREEWESWLINHPGINMDHIPFNQAFTGAGGGGGASMVRKQNRADGTFDDLPIAIAGGGGGTSANLTYDEIKNSGFNIPLPSERKGNTSEELYRLFINAKATTRDPELSEVVDGQRGFIKSDVFNQPFRAGAGGGWSTAEQGADGDGEFLSVADNFALGGFDCARQLSSRTSVAVENVNGGFGGGGGQCGGGGAGGGYTGGSIFGGSLNLPGGGGYYFCSTESKEIETSATSDSDGYVDIVPANCGCTSVCIVVGDMFECDCPNDTSLAPDGFDCTHGEFTYYTSC